jgi:hypothetical protein
VTLEHAPCGRCGQDTISGLSGSRACSVDVRVDAHPLTAVQELHALVAGCRTWTLHTVADELHPRTVQVIRSRPAGTRPRQTVHAEHRCPGRTPLP